MDKLARPRGLVRYDSLRGLRGEKRRVARPRIYIYSGLLVLGADIALLAFRSRTSFEANIVRLPGTPYVRENGTLRNGFELHVINKTSQRATFVVTPVADPELVFIVPLATIELEALESRRVPVFVTMETARFTADRPFVVNIEGAGSKRAASAMFLGARP